MVDPIVAEVRHAREAHAKKFNFDIHAICEDLRLIESRCDHPLASFEPKKLKANKRIQQTSEAGTPHTEGLPA